MYLLYLDESGSHGVKHGNRAYILAGLAVHERDAVALQTALDTALAREVPPDLHVAEQLELHATELFRLRRHHPQSPWHAIKDGRIRHAVLRHAIETVGRFGAADENHPVVLFAAIADPAAPDVQTRSYDVVLNRFDDYLSRLGQRGIAISDVAHNRYEELELQAFSNEWRAVATAAGQLDRLCDTVFFSDSRSSRLLQAADLVAWALWRQYGSQRVDARWIQPLLPRFETIEHLDRAPAPR